MSKLLRLQLIYWSVLSLVGQFCLFQLLNDGQLNFDSYITIAASFFGISVLTTFWLEKYFRFLLERLESNKRFAPQKMKDLEFRLYFIGVCGLVLYFLLGGDQILLFGAVDFVLIVLIALALFY
jgi:hypothetical protein